MNKKIVDKFKIIIIFQKPHKYHQKSITDFFSMKIYLLQLVILADIIKSKTQSILYEVFGSYTFFLEEEGKPVLIVPLHSIPILKNR